MKSPDEIKKGLECCNKGNCKKCPYRESEHIDCQEQMQKDALAYIQQLEAAQPNWISVEERLPDDLENVPNWIGVEYRLPDDLENVPNWISVNERLPHDLEEVLILVKETEFYGQYKELSKSYFCQYIGCVDDGEWFTVWCHGHRYIKDTAKEPCADKLEVTHWMPLPEPPKEDE